MHTGGEKTVTTALARSLALAYTALVVYASLHPFTGWRDSGVPLFAFLSGSWPRYYTGFDLITNVLAYVPLGFLWFPVAASHLGRYTATLLVCVLLALLSGSLETVQNFLPSRVPSNVDLICNTLGVLLGTLLAQRYGSMLLSESRLLRWRHKHLAHEPVGDYGLVLLGIWLLVQLNPDNILFGSGNLRQLLGLPAAMPFDVEGFSRVTGLIAMMGTLSLSLLLSLVLKTPRYWHVLALVGVAVVLRSFSAAVLISPDQFDSWFTRSNLGGIGIGLIFAWVGLQQSVNLRQLITALVIMASTCLMNIAPDNPYLLQAAQGWQQGHFLNFNGVTRVVASLWPFMALAFLMSGRREPR